MSRQVRDAHVGTGLRCTRRDGSPSGPGGSKAPLSLTHSDLLMHEQHANSCKIPKLYATLMRVTHFATRSSLALAVMVGLSFLLPGCGSSHSTPPMVTPPPTPETPELRLSTDPFTNPGSQHATEVEPAAFAFGSTIVTAFQVGRIFGGGASDIG